MVNHVIDGETIQHYDHEGKAYSIKLYYLEDQPIKAFVSFQMEVMNDYETMVGFGEDYHDKKKAIIKAIKHLHSQLN
jgi:hypothetical protein